MLGSSRWNRSRLLRVCIALGLAVGGVLLIWTALDRPPLPETAPIDSGAPSVQSVSSPQPTSSPARASAPRSASSPRTRSSGDKAGTPTGARIVPDRITGPLLPEADPLFVAIPRIGVRSSLVRLGLDARGELQVPQDPARAGWFTGGAAPGALGPAVIAGHVTWNGAPGVFYRLDGLRRGDQVIVGRADGKRAVFTVSRVARFAKSRFPTHAVYGPIDHAGLRLITCGGTYDAARHRYLDNDVVFANLSSVR